MWMLPLELGIGGPKLIHQSPIQTMFIQLWLTLQLFTLADESSYKKKRQGLKSNSTTQKQALFTQGFSVRFGEVGDCLGLPLGGINYTSFLKVPLWSSQKKYNASKLPRYLAVFLFMFLHQTFCFFSKFSILICQSVNVGHLGCYCQTSIAPPMTNVLPVQKHMLLLKKRCRNSLLLSSCLRSLRGEEQAQKYYLFFLGEFLTALLYSMLSIKWMRKPKLALFCLGYLIGIVVHVCSLWKSGRLRQGKKAYGLLGARQSKNFGVHESIFIWNLLNLQFKFMIPTYKKKVSGGEFAKQPRFIVSFLIPKFYSVCTFLLLMPML